MVYSQKKSSAFESGTNLTVKRRSELLGISRSSVYYKPVRVSRDLKLFDALSKIYEEIPYYGYRRLKLELQDYGLLVGRKKILKYKSELGLKTIYPKKNTSMPNKQHKRYPYLLNKSEIKYSNQVWSSDISYIRIAGKPYYFVGIMDWYSRKILSYKISSSLSRKFCLEALDEALNKYGKPEIFNSDQGCQYTSQEFTEKLKKNHIQISMNGKGRFIDNIMIERFFRNLKYEEIFIKDYSSVFEAKIEIKKYIDFYNQKRFHSSLNYQVPEKVYFDKLKEYEISQGVA